VASWFCDQVGVPTTAQQQAWPRSANGEHLLITAPTGSGKTLTAFLWAIDRLVSGPGPAALQMMVENKVGSTLVKEGSRIVGIYTERDLMRDHMSRGLKFAPHTDTAYDLMDKFLGLRLRHLLIDRDDEFIGLLSIGDVIKAALQDKTREFEVLERIANWQYHEEWKPRQ